MTAIAALVSRAGRLAGYAKLLFTPLALIVIVWLAWSAREQLLEILRTASAGLLLTSVLVWSLVHFLSPWFTGRFLASRGSQLGYASAWLIHAGRLPAKYLPGGVWHSVARIGDYRSVGLKPRQIGAYLLAENVLALAVSLGLGSMLLLLLGVSEPLWQWVLWLSLGLSLGLLAIAPVLYQRVQGPPKCDATVSGYLQSLLILMLFWLLAAMAFNLFLAAFAIVPEQTGSLYLGAVYLLSWGIGFMAVFAPQGIGVAELVQSRLIPADIGAQGLLALFVTFRFVVLAGDMLVYLLAVCASRSGLMRPDPEQAES